MRRVLIQFDRSNFYNKAKKLLPGIHLTHFDYMGLAKKLAKQSQLIAIDIAVGAVKNVYDVCYLLSSDTDLLPAVETAQQEGKEVVYVGFKGAVSHAMKNNCTKTIVLDEMTLTSF